MTCGVDSDDNSYRKCRESSIGPLLTGWPDLDELRYVLDIVQLGQAAFGHNLLHRRVCGQCYCYAIHYNLIRVAALRALLLVRCIR